MPDFLLPLHNSAASLNCCAVCKRYSHGFESCSMHSGDVLQSLTTDINFDHRGTRQRDGSFNKWVDQIRLICGLCGSSRGSIADIYLRTKNENSHAKQRSSCFITVNAKKRKRDIVGCKRGETKRRVEQREKKESQARHIIPTAPRFCFTWWFRKDVNGFESFSTPRRAVQGC
jgi:hypothetical protein